MTYDTNEAAKYDAWVTAMTFQDHDACITDLKRYVTLSAEMDVLDVGAGTGALCLALTRVPGLHISALEPCDSMCDLLQAKPELTTVYTTQGFCDHADDRLHFSQSSFDLIASRQLANCLYDPLAAFRNWHYWLRSGGTVVMMDGLFDRDDWSDRWDGIVDTLPLSACRTTATVPYLLEQTGFHIEHVRLMESTNALPSTRTQRYIVVASKVDG
ncbi:MAG TPA: hypothetical protein DD473_13865 [Planctomycetaceae bacterium]|nr:hypothetical protein [Planctomycetaceae bacterium]